MKPKHGKYQKSRRGKRKRRGSTQGVLGVGLSSGNDTNSDEISTHGSVQLTPERELSLGLPTPQSNRSKQKTPRESPLKAKYDKSPPLLFRYWGDNQGINSADGFYAGKFVNIQTQIPPPTWDRESVSNHLGRKKISTPYISFRDSFRFVVHGALGTPPTADPYFAIIDFQRLKATLAARWGKRKAIEAAPELVSKFELKFGRWKNYGGGGEWMVYGKVRSTYDLDKAEQNRKCLERRHRQGGSFQRVHATG